MNSTDSFRRELIHAPGHRLPVQAAFPIYQRYLVPTELSRTTQQDFIDRLRESGEIVGQVEGKLYIANRLLPKGLYVDCGGALKLLRPHHMTST